MPKSCYFLRMTEFMKSEMLLELKTRIILSIYLKNTPELHQTSSGIPIRSSNYLGRTDSLYTG